MKLRIVFLFCFCFSSLAFGWGSRGHEIVTSVAAKLLEKDNPKFLFLKNHEFDLGYYANVPDIIWRALPPPARNQEPPQHYIDWTKDLAAVFGSAKNLPVDFYEYKKVMGEKFSLKNGVSPYRIAGLVKRCRSLAVGLTRDKQGPLLECLGLVSHYTGDLSMPLHVSENHDGQLTGQEGIHVFFEGVLVNELDPDLKVDVLRMATDAYGKSEFAKLDSNAAVRWMITDSFNHVDELLADDKAVGRRDLLLAREKYKILIQNCLVQGALLTALVWKEILGPIDHFDDKQFFYFNSKPDYLEPGKETNESKISATQHRIRNWAHGEHIRTR